MQTNTSKKTEWRKLFPKQFEGMATDTCIKSWIHHNIVGGPDRREPSIRPAWKVSDSNATGIFVTTLARPLFPDMNIVGGAFWDIKWVNNFDNKLTRKIPDAGKLRLMSLRTWLQG